MPPRRRAHLLDVLALVADRLRHRLLGPDERPSDTRMGRKEAKMIELTPEQAQAQAEQKAPLHVLNPVTQEVFVLIRKDVYDLTCRIVGGGKGRVWDDEA